MAWESNQYLKFEKERTQSSKDLISRLDNDYKNILDLGCGPANSTYQLSKRFKNSNIVGFDADINMLNKAKEKTKKTLEKKKAKAKKEASKNVAEVKKDAKKTGKEVGNDLKDVGKDIGKTFKDIFN